MQKKKKRSNVTFVRYRVINNPLQDVIFCYNANIVACVQERMANMSTHFITIY